MYFTKDEIIELNDTRKYLVLDTALIDDVVYYKVKEVAADESQTVGEVKYITAINDEGKLFINENLTSDEITKLEEIFLNGSPKSSGE